MQTFFFTKMDEQSLGIWMFLKLPRLDLDILRQGLLTMLLQKYGWTSRIVISLIFGVLAVCCTNLFVYVHHSKVKVWKGFSRKLSMDFIPLHPPITQSKFALWYQEWCKSIQVKDRHVRIYSKWNVCKIKLMSSLILIELIIKMSLFRLYDARRIFFT